MPNGSKITSVIALIIAITSLGISASALRSKSPSAGKESIFENNLKCATYIPTAKNEAKQKEENGLGSSSLVEVFYSPKLKSCVAAYNTYGNDPVNRFFGFYIKDLLTNKDYSWTLSDDELKVLNKQGKNGMEDYEAKIQELKSEI